MSTRPPLRRVLLVAIGGVAVGAVILTALLTFGLTRLTAQRNALRDLGRDADRLAAFAEEVPCRDGRVGRFAVQRELGPRARFIPGETPPFAEPDGRTEIDGRRVLYAARSVEICGRPGTLVVTSSARGAPPLPEGLVGRLLVAGLVSVAGASLVAYLLARRLVRPLGELAGSARALASGGDADDVAQGGRGDPAEVAELRRDFVDMARDLRSARDREKAFLLSVSHELKTPLTAIRGYGEALTDGTARTPEAAGEVVVRESRRLERLVGDLIDLARLEAGEFSIELGETDLGLVATAAVEALGPSASDAGVALEVRVASAQRVTSDGDRVHQMIANLVENALRVTPDGGRVTVDASGRTVTVSDSGPGLSPEDVEHAFERFYLWRRYRGVRPVGSGLGLAIVDELAARLGVRLAVESAQDGGTRFTLIFDA